MLPLPAHGPRVGCVHRTTLTTGQAEQVLQAVDPPREGLVPNQALRLMIRNNPAWDNASRRLKAADVFAIGSTAT